MDRFIVNEAWLMGFDVPNLKSNMDRFIVPSAVKQVSVLCI